MPSGNLIDASIIFILGGPPTFSGFTGIIAARCTCDDGNLADGDGCSSRCQVEPCWTCTGDPSTCSPSPDGSACEDGSVCTTQETCAGGTCGGGSVVSPCVDMTGPWLSNGSRGPANPYQLTSYVTQRGTDLIVRDVSDVARVAGTIDPATGAFDVRIARTSQPPDSCGEGFDTLIGSATSLAYAASGTSRRPRPAQPSICDSLVWTETGTRCGNNALDPGETCDDGNVISGDGCSASCAVETCWHCTGIPSTCALVPRTPCKSTTAPTKSLLSIKNVGDPNRDALLWRWKRGQDTNLAELGNPAASDDYVLCLFDESSPTPALLFSARLPAGCVGDPCWSPSGSSSMRYRSESSLPEGITKAKLKAGVGGTAQAQTRGKGALLSNHAYPPLPLPLPVRMQLQGANGFCAETRHDSSSVLKNDPSNGIFKARGAP